MDGQKMTYLTHVMMSFVGKRVEVSNDTEQDGLRGILKSFVIERHTITAVIEVRNIIDRLTNKEGKLYAAPFEDIIDLSTSNPLDIYTLGLAEECCALDEDGEPLNSKIRVEAEHWRNVRKEQTKQLMSEEYKQALTEDIMEEMYEEFYESCPCNFCQHSGTLDTLGENSPCRVCVIADTCSEIDSNCAECKYRDLTEEGREE